jgi:hypothetical protein
LSARGPGGREQSDAGKRQKNRTAGHDSSVRDSDVALQCSR